MSPEALAQWVAESRRKQGLPPRVEDPEILETVAAIVTSDRRRAPDAGEAPTEVNASPA